MEFKFFHSRVSSETDKIKYQTNEETSLTARKRLLEKCLQKDFVTSKKKTRTLSSDKMMNYFKADKSALMMSTGSDKKMNYFKSDKSALMTSTGKPQDFKKILESKDDKIAKIQSKSPASTKRNKSNEHLNKPKILKNDSARSRPVQLATSNRRKFEKPTDAISKHTEQFSVKKFNVRST